MKKVTLILTSLLIITLFIAACSDTTTSTTPSTAVPTSSSPTTSAPTKTTSAPSATTSAPSGEKYGGVLKLPQTAGPAGTLGYIPEMANATGVIMLPVFETLLKERYDGTVKPMLATSWDIGDDAKSITFHLRQGVKFHDGSDFNADVAIWNLKIAMQKQADTKTWTSIDKIDDYTIRINLTEYTNTLFSGFGKMGVTGMMSKEAVEKNGVEWANEHPVGTGPFIFDNYERDVKITFTRNPNYWDEGKPYLDGVEILVIPDAMVQRLSFEKSGIHQFTPTTPSIAKELEATAKYDMNLRPSGPVVLVPNSMDEKSPWADINVRYAASYAIDREALAEALGAGYSTPPYQLMQGFEDVVIKDLVKTTYNLEKAKELLKEAGYPDGFKTTITGRPVRVPANQVSAVAAMLQEAGINAEINTVTSARYNEMRIGGTWDGILAESMLVTSNKNFTFTSYFTALQWDYVKRPAGLAEGIKASLAQPEADPEYIKAIIQIIYDDMTIIPFYEELTMDFQNKGYHEDYVINNYSEANLPLYADVWLDSTLR